MAQYIKADLDEIVFENREKRYGGYILRKEYTRYLFFAFLSVLAFFALATVGPILYEKYLKDIGDDAGKVEVAVDLSNLPPPPPEEDKNTPPPPPPPPKQQNTPPPPPVETKAFKIPEPKPKEMVKEEQTIANIDSLKDKVVDTKDQKGEKPVDANAFVPPDPTPGGTGTGMPKPVQDEPKPTPPTKTEPDPNKFVPVQKQPAAVNLGDIQKEIGYPTIAREGGIEGDVTLRILVDEEGNYVKHIVIKQVHPILLKAVEEHVRKVKFTPAIQGNKPIQFWVNVPFKFKLN